LGYLGGALWGDCARDGTGSKLNKAITSKMGRLTHFVIGIIMANAIIAVSDLKSRSLMRTGKINEVLSCITSSDLM
jgi:hypothetical protein